MSEHLFMPTKFELSEFLRIWERMCRHDAQQRFMRGYGACDDKDYPNEGCIKTVAWLKELHDEL